MTAAGLLFFAWLIGSIPFSFLIVKLKSGKDVREFGSGNVGATNAARTGGRLAGVLALLLDIAKGYAAVALARWIVARPDWPFAAGLQPWESREFWIAAAGVIAVVGHMFPVWLGFRGGKGVATASGVFLALSPIVMAGAVLVFAIVAMATRYVSLASIVTAAAAPLLFRFLAQDSSFWHFVASILVALMVIAKHHSNIARLANGTERRIGRKDND